MNPVPGDDLDRRIKQAIDKCPVFIPLISRNSRQIVTGNNKLKHHVKEWERAYSESVSGNDKTIIPVKIDATDWMYEPFKQLFYLNIPGGRRGGDYETLRHRLMEVRQRFRE